MGTTYSFKRIIEEALSDKGWEPTEVDILAYRRAFYKLLERIGSDKEILKIQNKENTENKKVTKNEAILFDEFEKPVIKTLLLQLMDQNSMIYEFTHAKNDKAKFSAEETNDFLKALKAEIFKDPELVDEDMRYLSIYLDNIFLYSPLRSIETCHKLIDALAANLSDLPCDEQSTYLGKVEHILKKEFWLRTAESAIESLRIAENIKYKNEPYVETDPAIRAIYIRRDSEILKAIKEDDDLRQYIEKKTGRKAEAIFGYAQLK